MPDGRRDTQVSSVHCSIERPEDRVPCNQFECESSKVALIDLTLDMDYESSLYPVSNGEQSFVEFLKEDIQNIKIQGGGLIRMASMTSLMRDKEI